MQSATPAFAAFRSQAKRSPGGSSRVKPEDSQPDNKRYKGAESVQELSSAAAGSEVTLAHGIADAAVTSSEVDTHLLPCYMRKNWCGSQLECTLAEAPVNDPELGSGAAFQGLEGVCPSLHYFDSEFEPEYAGWISCLLCNNSTRECLLHQRNQALRFHDAPGDAGWRCAISPG